MLIRAVLVRVVAGVATVLVASTLVFFGTEALPGDAAQTILGDQATPALLAQYRRDLGLNRPILLRYADWLRGIAHGDLGRSIPSNDPVSHVIGDKLRNTATLAGFTLALLIPLAILLGVTSAVRHNRAIDHGISGTTLWLMAIPDFVVGPLLAILFSVWLGVLPSVSLIDPTRPLYRQLSSFVLPLLTLICVVAAQSIRMIRACMIDVLDSDYVLLARLKGVPEWLVLLRHALPNAMGPTLQILAMQVAWLAGGVVIVETVFQFPGVGMALTGAVQFRDLATVQAIVILITAGYVLFNLLADIAVVLLNPRLRRAS